jgi:hypothetical protein
MSKPNALVIVPPFPVDLSGERVSRTQTGKFVESADPHCV